MKTFSLSALLIICLSTLLHAEERQFDLSKLKQLDPEKIKELRARYGQKMANALPPTESDIAYGKHERNRLDLWKAKSRKPSPVLVYIHGGAFRMGDKKMIHAQIPVQDYLDQGVSCISVNYPFMQHTNDDIQAIYRHCEDALDYIIRNAKEWNIDPKRISLAGASAGAAISQNIGYSTDKVHTLIAFNQPKKTDRMILPQVKKGGPPTFIYHENDADDRMHPPECARMLKEACDEKGIECHLYGTGDNTLPKLPNGETPEAAVLDFLMKKWK